MRGSPVQTRRSTRRLPVAPISSNWPDSSAGQVDLLVRGATAVGRIGEHVVDCERAADRHLRCPALVVGARRLDAVPAIDEEEGQRRVPVRRDDRRHSHDTDDGALEIGLVDRADEHGQRVETPGRGVDERGVVVLPPRLVLLRAAMVIDREEHCGRIELETCSAEIHGGLAAVRADLEQREARVGASGFDRGVVKRKPFVDGHEAPRRFGDRPQPGVHVSGLRRGLGS